MNFKTFVALCLMCCLSIEGNGQNLNNKIDSLERMLQSQVGKSRIESLFFLSNNYIPLQSDLALCYALEGYHLSMLYGDSLNMVRTGLLVGSVMRRTQRLDSAILMYNKILPIAERNGYMEELRIGLNSSGITLTQSGDYDKALSQYFKTLEMRRSLGDTVALVAVLNNIGTVYYKLKDYQRALQVFLRCRDLQRDSDQKFDADLVSINIGHAYAYLMQYDSALRYIDLGLAFCGAQCAMSRYVEANFVKGLVYFGRKELSKAEKYFRTSYWMAESENNTRFQLDNIDYLSQIYLETGNYSSASHFLNVGKDLLRNHPSFKLEASKLFLRLSDLYRCMNNFERAYEYQTKHMEMKDAVYSSDLTNSLMRIEAGYLERENLEKISSQKSLLLLMERQISNQKMINLLASLLVIASVALAMVLYHSYKQKVKINEILGSKIDEKTRQFRANTENLLKVLTERNTILTMRSYSISLSLLRIKGICHIALKEALSPVCRCYIVKIDSIIDQCKISNTMQDPSHPRQGDWFDYMEEGLQGNAGK